MSIGNFDFLNQKWPNLSQLGSEAEEYVFSDPQSSLMKLRCFIEVLVEKIYRDLNLYSEDSWDLFAKLKNKTFSDLINNSIMDKFHAIRVKGNKAVHANQIFSSQDSLWLIEEAYEIACWVYKSYHRDMKFKCNKFSKPIDNGKRTDLLHQTIQDLEKTLEAERKKNKQIVTNNSNNFEITNDFKNRNNEVAQKMNVNSNRIIEHISLKELFSDYELTQSQQTLVTELGDFLNNKNKNIFLLKGYAGTGKTFITKGLTEYLTTIGRKFVLAAPTGKAAKVIQEKTKSDAFTIHKTIYSDKDLKEYKVNDDDRTYKFYFDLRVNENPDDTIYIIDEASMISNVYNEMEFLRFGSGFLLNDFMSFINIDQNDHNKKVIFIGDNAQLPPIGMNFSPALNDSYLKENYGLTVEEFELTEVVRQENESGILLNSIKLRKSLESKIFNQIKIDTTYRDVKHIDHDKFIQKYIELTDKKVSKDTMVIAYTNSSVKDYNQSIRQLFFNDIETIHVNDKVMILSNSSFYEVYLSNGDFGLVKNILSETETKTITLKRKNEDTNIVEEIKVNLHFRDIEIIVKDINDSPKLIKCKVIENLLFSEKASLSSDENKALYLDFVFRNQNLKPNTNEFKNQIKSDPYFNALKIKFGYAITCHKAQGSEWKNVILNCRFNENVLSESYFRWLYTAITRASENLYTIDEPQVGVFDKISATHIHMEHIVDHSINNQLKSSEDNTFNISDSFLLSIYQKINAIVSLSNIKIIHLQHNPYQEIYTFEKYNEQLRCIIYYNSQNIITNINTIETTKFTAELQNILSPLKNHAIVTTVSSEFSFDEEFLADYYNTVSNILKELNINISYVNHMPYRERYTFLRGEEIAIIDFVYNGQGQFTSISPSKKSNSKQLIADIMEHLK
jgi:hypothetical protein